MQNNKPRLIEITAAIIQMFTMATMNDVCIIWLSFLF